MSGTPDVKPDDADDESGSPKPSDAIAVDVFGAQVNTKLEISISPHAVSLVATLPRKRKSASEIYETIIAQLQAVLVAPFEFLANCGDLAKTVPTLGTSLIESVKSAGESVAGILRRIAEGRSQADHSEDEKITDVLASDSAEASPVKQGAIVTSGPESQADSLNAIFAFLEQFRDEHGFDLPVIRNPDGTIIFLPLPPELQVIGLQETQDKLLEHRPKTETPLSSLGIDRRTANILGDVGILTKEELEQYTAAQILSISGIGPKRIVELLPYLRQL